MRGEKKIVTRRKTRVQEKEATRKREKKEVKREGEKRGAIRDEREMEGSTNLGQERGGIGN